MARPIKIYPVVLLFFSLLLFWEFNGDMKNFILEKIDKEEKDKTKFQIHIKNQRGENTLVIVQDSYFWSWGLKFGVNQPIGLIPLGLNFKDIWYMTILILILKLYKKLQN